MADCDQDGGCGSLHAELDRRGSSSRGAVAGQIAAVARAASTRTATANALHAQPDTTEDEPPEIDRTRRCARDRRCGDRQRVQGPDGRPIKAKGHLVYVGVPINTDRGLCTICTQTVRNEIPHLAADWRELATLIAAGGDTTGEVVSSSRDLPVPIRLSVEALMRDIDVETTLWAEQVAEALGQDWDIEAAWTSRARIRVERAVSVLTNTTDTLTQLPAIDRDVYRGGERVRVWRPDPEGGDVLSTGATGWHEYTYWAQDGLDAALRMLDLHDRTRILAGRGELVHKLPAPCPNPRCGRLTLVRPNGKDHVECETCHERWAEEDYKRLTDILASDENRRIKACNQCDKIGRLRDRTVCDHSAPVRRGAA
ncbi:hypothetical protein EV383_4405 [Pseudonocardia sediminis]|uniref:Uncharacterized protein n=1 Tax=Pseudonocardia sediminis TaxID=1397368 RepID=A0A4V2FR69_PSEST|nr:hypothetical protein [Pseudonocardia sediminis]RZT87480.1 hypothetical protein EV383_4405 [Pseudonocardia sediminis]